MISFLKMTDRTCYKCHQQVGRNHEGKWIYYRKVLFENKNVCYKCDYICYPLDHNIWKCTGCNKYYNREVEFCDTITSYCVPCLTKYRESSDTDLICSCFICSEINNSFNYIPK